MKGHLLIFLFLIFANSIDSRLRTQVEFQIESADLKSDFYQIKSPSFLVDSQATICQDSLRLNFDCPIDDADVLPKYPGGDDSLLVFLINNINYSNVRPEADVEGRVIVKFVVTKFGKIKDIQLIKGLEPFYDKEVLRVVSLLPDFVPGMKDGHPVAAYFTLPFGFRLEK